MADNLHTLLTSYFQYQRDIGAGDIIFAPGSAVKKMLAAGGAAADNNRVDESSRHVSTPRRKSAQTPQKTSGAPVSVKSGTDDGAPSFSKLSKIRTVDDLDMPKFERRPVSPAVNQSAKREKLTELYREVINCDKCPLSRSRNKIVFGSGSADGKILVIGDIPGVDDDASGLPFQGDEGQLFDRILGKMGLDKKRDIFVTHIQKCHSAEFVHGHGETCRPALDRQIDIIEPEALLIFGRPAANFLLGNDYDIEQLRGINHIYKDRPAVVTYSLTLMLKEEQYRFGGWEDMKRVMSIIS